MSPAEELIHSMDEKTGASLKLTILNPKGRIWTMVAGGGASVIYADTVGDLGYAHELGNYAEYSGAPNEEETLQYARALIDCATANPDGQRRALVVGGGIANFTDVAATFNGIIRAMHEKVLSTV
jgi:ATP citrate (pro-S)-lyase